MSDAGLDDPEYAAFAWRRFRRLLGWIGLVGAVSAVAAVAILDRIYGPMGWIAILATIGGVAATVTMAGALMGLAFLSSGTGHDEQVRRFDLDQSSDGMR